MSERRGSPRLGVLGGLTGRGAVDKDQRPGLRGSLQQREGALAGYLAERAVRAVAIGLAGGLRVTKLAVRGNAEAILERGLRTIGVRDVDGHRRRQQDF